MQWLADRFALVADDREDDAFPTVPEERRRRIALPDTHTVVPRLGVSADCSTLVWITVPGAWCVPSLDEPEIRIWLGSFDDWSSEESLRESLLALGSTPAIVLTVAPLDGADYLAGRVEGWGRYRSAYSLRVEQCALQPPLTLRVPTIHVVIPTSCLSSWARHTMEPSFVFLMLEGEERTHIAKSCNDALAKQIMSADHSVAIGLGIFHRSHPDTSQSCARKALLRCIDPHDRVGMTVVHRPDSLTFLLVSLDVPSPRPFVSPLRWRVPPQFV